MKYKSGYKYQLASDESFQLLLSPGQPCDTKFISLSTSGQLIVKHGYAWDGVSGPVRDRRTNMRASLCHDALYQLMRMGLIPFTEWRSADKEFARVLKQDGAWSITVKVDMMGLKIAGGKAARPSYIKKIKTAP